MHLRIEGRGKPRATFGLVNGDEGTIRVDCNRDPSIWYEIPITRSVLELMLEQMDNVEEEEEETVPEGDTGTWKFWTSRFGLAAPDEDQTFPSKREAVQALRKIVKEMNTEHTRFQRISETEYHHIAWDANKPMKIGVEQVKAKDACHP